MEETAIGCARKKQKGEEGGFLRFRRSSEDGTTGSGQMSLGFCGLRAFATTQSTRRRAMGEGEWWIAGMA
jgi:hypothetical protein